MGLVYVVTNSKNGSYFNCAYRDEQAAILASLDIEDEINATIKELDVELELCDTSWEEIDESELPNWIKII